jgi:hypothetical protein
MALLLSIKQMMSYHQSIPNDFPEPIKYHYQRGVDDVKNLFKYCEELSARKAEEEKLKEKSQSELSHLSGAESIAGDVTTANSTTQNNTNETKESSTTTNATGPKNKNNNQNKKKNANNNNKNNRQNNANKNNNNKNAGKNSAPLAKTVPLQDAENMTTQQKFCLHDDRSKGFLISMKELKVVFESTL